MTYEVGTKVLIDPNYEEEFLEHIDGLYGNDREKRKQLWLQHEVIGTDDDDESLDNEIRLGGDDGHEIWINSNWLEEAEFDPATEPLTPGDECKLIVDTSDYFGLDVEVVHVDGEGPDAVIRLWNDDWGDTTKTARRKHLALYAKRETNLRKGNKVTVLEGDKVLRRLDRGGIREDHIRLMMGKRFTIKDHTMRARLRGDEEYEEGFLLNTEPLCGRDYWVPVDCVQKFEGVDDTAPSTAGTSTAIKTGDMVRVLDTTQEVKNYNDLSLKEAMMVSKHVGKVMLLDTNDPKYRVKTPKGPRAWVTKVEKVSA